MATSALKLAIEGEPPRGPYPSSHREGQVGPSSATSTAGSAGTTTKPRKASTSPTTPKKPRKYPHQHLHDLQNEFADSSILQAVESGLAGETFPILSAGSIAFVSTLATASASAPTSAHTTVSTSAAIKGRIGGAAPNPNPTQAQMRTSTSTSQHQKGTVPTSTPTSIPILKGNVMHIIPGESLAHLWPLPFTWRIALGRLQAYFRIASPRSGDRDVDAQTKNIARHENNGPHG